MPKTDDGFQGVRPFAHGDVWDRMDSQTRRQAFKWDLIVGFGGAFIVFLLCL